MTVQKQEHHPHYGEVIHDKNGNVVCHICGKSYKKLLTHVWQTHGYTKQEYKLMFGLDQSKGLIADSTREKLQNAVAKHYDVVVKTNLIKHGSNTRFTEGHGGRTRDKVSEQTRRVLVNQITKIGHGGISA